MERENKEKDIRIRCTESFKEETRESARSIGLDLSSYVTMLITLDKAKRLNKVVKAADRLGMSVDDYIMMSLTGERMKEEDIIEIDLNKGSEDFTTGGYVPITPTICKNDYHRPNLEAQYWKNKYYESMENHFEMIAQMSDKIDTLIRNLPDEY